MGALDEKDFRHPGDISWMNRIWENVVIEKIQTFLLDNGIEDVYACFDKASCIEISGEMSPAIQDMLAWSCDRFGLKEIPSLYVKRDYDLTAEIHGFDNPYIVISEHFLNKLSDEMLRGILASRVAGILAGHHKTMFLLWSAKFFSGLVPGFSVLVGVASNQWMRARFYTYDRAFLLATHNLELTLQSILANTLSEHALKRMKCGTGEDLFDSQVKDFHHTNSIPKAYYYLYDSQDWAPERYSEIQRFYLDLGGGQMRA